MGKDIDILIGCAEVFNAIGLKRISKKIIDYLENPNSDKAEIFQKEVEVWKEYEEHSKGRMFVFSDGEHALMKYFIISYEKDWYLDGNPAIVINKLEDESASFKDNPIKNLWVVYKNEEDRDKDFERLLTIK